MSDEKYHKCRFNEKGFFEPCMGMDVLLESRNEVSGLGAHIMHLMNLETGDESDGGVTFKISKRVASEANMNSTEVMLNYCPFCGETVFKKKKELEDQNEGVVSPEVAIEVEKIKQERDERIEKLQLELLNRQNEIVLLKSKLERGLK